jgi:PST family polysaccharide transporter
VLVGLTSGAAAVGMINWAQTLAAFPVWALMPFQRLYMPVFAGLQRDRATLGHLVERTVTATNGIVAPAAVFTLALSEPITRIVFGEVWLPGRPIFALLWTANLWVATATPLLALVNALGKPRTAFTFAVLWMAATWLLGVPLIVMAGPLGYAMANALVQLINLALFRFAKRLVPMRLLGAAATPWLAAAAVGIPLAGAAARWPPSGPVALGVFLATAFIGYAGLLTIALVRSWFRRSTNDR